jgi:hypothetical protein
MGDRGSMARRVISPSALTLSNMVGTQEVLGLAWPGAG